MKLNQLVLLGVASSLLCVSGYATGVSANPTSSEVSPTTSTGSNVIVAQKPAAASTKASAFVAGEAPASGTVRIVTKNGGRFLEFDQAFKTSDQGPDLHVVLDPAAKPPAKYEDTTRYVNLGKLHKFNGAQSYPIPAGINLANYKSVVVWCRMANATFAYAPLEGASSARAR